MANGNLSVQVQGNIYATLQAVAPPNTITENVVIPLATTMIPGTGGDAVVNQLFSGQFTVAGTSSTTYNLVNFNGTLDAVDNPYSLSTVKLFFVQNLSGTYGNYLTVSGS